MWEAEHTMYIFVEAADISVSAMAVVACNPLHFVMDTGTSASLLYKSHLI